MAEDNTNSTQENFCKVLNGYFYPESIKVLQILLEQGHPFTQMNLSLILEIKTLTVRDLQVLCAFGFKLTQDLYLKIINYHNNQDSDSDLDHCDALMYFLISKNIVPNNETMRYYFNSYVLVSILDKFPQTMSSFICIRFMLLREKDNCFPFLAKILKKSDLYNSNGWCYSFIDRIRKYEGNIVKLFDILDSVQHLSSSNVIRIMYSGKEPFLIELYKRYPQYFNEEMMIAVIQNAKKKKCKKILEFLLSFGIKYDFGKIEEAIGIRYYSSGLQRKDLLNLFSADV